MEINKAINLSARIKISEIDVANLTATISNNGLNHNIGVFLLNKELIDLNEENKISYENQYNEFIESVKEYLA